MMNLINNLLKIFFSIVRSRTYDRYEEQMLGVRSSLERIEAVLCIYIYRDKNYEAFGTV